MQPNRLLVLTGVQNDFFRLPFGNTRMSPVLPRIVDYVQNWDGDIIVVKETRLTEDQIKDGLACVPGIVPWDQMREYIYTGFAEHCIKWSEGWQIVPELLPVLQQKNEKSCRFRTVEAYGQTWHDWANNIMTYSDIVIAGTKMEDQIISTVYAIRAIRPEVPIKVPIALCAGDHETTVRETCHIIDTQVALTWSLP